MNMRLIIVAGLAGALATAVGCGSSGSSSTDAGGGKGGGTGGGGGKGGSGGGAGGAAGGGTGGGAGGTPGLVNHLFNTDAEGFVLNNYADPARINLAGNYMGDGGIDAGTAAPTLTWDSAVGNPSAGSLKITATWTNYDQYVDVVINQGQPTPGLLNLAGKTLHAMVMLDSATLPPSFGVQLHASTGPNYSSYGNGAFTTLTMGTWVPLTLDLSTVTSTGWDPTMVVQIGVQLSSGGVPADAGTFGSPLTVTFHVDTITD
jgi:hypothetical protein